MSEHSPEPWKVEPSDDHDDRFEIDHSGNGSIVGCDGLFEADARRIVACVNLLAGVAIEDLEKALAIRDAEMNQALREGFGQAVLRTLRTLDNESVKIACEAWEELQKLKRADSTDPPPA